MFLADFLNFSLEHTVNAYFSWAFSSENYAVVLGINFCFLSDFETFVADFEIGSRFWYRKIHALIYFVFNKIWYFAALSFVLSSV